MLAHVYEQVGPECPDVEEPAVLRGFFAAEAKIGSKVF